MALRDSIKTQMNLITTESVSSFRFCPCGRRHFIGAAMTSMPFLPISPSHASTSTEDLKRLRPPKPDWYEEFFAWSMNSEVESYEKEASEFHEFSFILFLSSTDSFMSYCYSFVRFQITR
jgi:hypothetical protein